MLFLTGSRRETLWRIIWLYCLLGMCTFIRVVGGKMYKSTDKGPFLVHVSWMEPDLSSGYTIRPLKLGQFLFTNNVSKICEKSR